MLKVLQFEHKVRSDIVNLEKPFRFRKTSGKRGRRVPTKWPDRVQMEFVVNATAERVVIGSALVRGSTVVIDLNIMVLMTFGCLN